MHAHILVLTPVIHCPRCATGFLLPRGYPESVSDDYLAYQLWAFPCHICVRRVPLNPPPPPLPRRLPCRSFAKVTAWVRKTAPDWFLTHYQHQLSFQFCFGRCHRPSSCALIKHGRGWIVQGWMSHSLATSSLLKAVGVDPGAAGTAGATAAVKWITKDGIGALGRLLVSG